MDYIKKTNEIKAKIIELLENAEIQNLKGIKLRVVDVGLSNNIDTGECPILAVYKLNVSGEHIRSDQPSVDVPRMLTINLALADYSIVSVNEAESLTDDLLEKILGVLIDNPTLDGFVDKYIVSNITFDEIRDRGVFFSIPEISLEILLKGVY